MATNNAYYRDIRATYNIVIKQSFKVVYILFVKILYNVKNLNVFFIIILEQPILL